MEGRSRRTLSKGVKLFLAVAAFGGVIPLSYAETPSVRVAYQYGFQYVPLFIMKQRHLIEKEAAKLGVKDVHVRWLQLSGGGAISDALLSGNLDFGEVGTAPAILMWSKTKGNVKAVAAVDSTPMVLTTNDPNVNHVRDFTEKDRIALPTVKTSMEALALQFEATKIWGQANYGRLSKLTVAMKHPDAAAAMLSGNRQITAHFTVPPFSTMELNNPSVHKVIDSHQIFDNDRATQDLIYTTTIFRKENPKVYRAFFNALTEATQIAEKDRKLDAEVYIRETHTTLKPALVSQVLGSPNIHYSTVPNATAKLAGFMAKIKMISAPPTTWKDLFFPEIHGENGS